MKNIKNNKRKLTNIIAKFFIISMVIVFTFTLLVGIYFNNSYEQEKIKESSKTTHNILAQLIVPSLNISDTAEIKKLLYMSSGENEFFAVKDRNNIVLMSDYGKTNLYNFIHDDKTINCEDFNQVKVLENVKYLINCSLLVDSNNDYNKVLGKLLSFKKETIINFSPLIIYTIISLIILFLILFFILRKIILKLFLEPVVILKKYLSNSHSYSMENMNEKINSLPYELYEIKLTFDEEYFRRVEAEKSKALVDIMAGVCHDIRSPLASLDLCLSEGKTHIPESLVEIQCEAIQSIRSIANNVLEKYRVNNQINTNSDNQVKFFLLSSMLEIILFQKKHEWRHLSVETQLAIEQNADSSWLEANPNELKRVLSNLINNAYESLNNEKGRIEISLRKISNMVSVCISDNGVGIPFHHINDVINGFSTKHPGKGLGLSSSKQFIENMNGSLSISSDINIGTKIYLNFPVKNNPSWFPDKILIEGDSEVVIVDDDKSIHAFWDKKLKKYNIKANNFLSGQDFLNWYHLNIDKKLIFIMDYQLGSEKLNGLELLKIINPEKKGYLITSSAENHNLQNEIAELNLWLFPKKLIAEIPLSIINVNPHPN